MGTVPLKFGHISERSAIRADVGNLMRDDQMVGRVDSALHVVTNDSGAFAARCHWSARPGCSFLAVPARLYSIAFLITIARNPTFWVVAGYGGRDRLDPNMIVHFTLQGYGKRIEEALAAIEAGTKKSTGVSVAASPAAVELGLDRFTIIDWTSTNRNITNPYTPVFTLRPTTELFRPAMPRPPGTGSCSGR